MLRTVPETINEEVDLYIRTYYSLLRSSEAVRVRSLEETHAGMRASLHPRAEDSDPDVPALAYAAMRLPPSIYKVKRVLLGQSEEVFLRRAGINIDDWQQVYAPARRRKMFFDGQGLLAAYISSVSDIDDLIPILTAYQIEWNKLHQRLQPTEIGLWLRQQVRKKKLSDSRLNKIRTALGLSADDFRWLQRVWQDEFFGAMRSLATEPADLQLNLLAGSAADYRQAVQAWWRSLITIDELGPIYQRPIYFVSSNPHALPNLLNGYARQHKADVLAYLQAHNPDDLWLTWQTLEEKGHAADQENLLYYLQRSFLALQPQHAQDYHQHEHRLGIHRVDQPHYLDVSGQVIELAKLDPACFDPRLAMPGLERLRQSQALIINIDYPLGMAAYLVFSQLSSDLPDVQGVYIMGKAASLNGRVGDVMIPNVVYDEHSKNTYLFRNSFRAGDVRPYLLHGDVFDNQKSVTVRGTFLQNRQFMHVFYREGYTDIEMEAGPYLSGIYEDIYPQRYPVNEIVNLFINAPYDIGILHYASDTPYSRRQSLLSKGLSYFGVDATYATSIAILRRIMEAELARLGG
ncbi:MAG: hypothetical protein IAE85_13440 [Anaerolinea sp.]|nr:hypothetical protein [Anaerolinea sp.]HRI56123.1 hypothetical protein [Anaerolineae bacterium]